MRIKALVENESNGKLKAIHGLSLYIETKKHKILFDLGPDGTLFKNAKREAISLAEVDTVIISHGHFDHGGALNRFLEVNRKAKIYIQKKAFQPHQSKVLFLKTEVGLNQKMENHQQVILIEGDYEIDEELRLFTISDTKKCYSSANDGLLESGKEDKFLHEQNLVIKEHQTALIMGCGHAGVVNIMEKAKQYNPNLCVGGFHLFNPATKKTVPETLLNNIVKELQQYKEVRFYTCHCTGKVAFQYFKETMPNMFYLSCGEEIVQGEETQKHLIREMCEHEYPLLTDFLYEAIFQKEGESPVPRRVLENLELKMYIDGFGTGKDDYCLCAQVGRQVVGAVWVRTINGYGYVDDETPEFAISLYKEYRGRGIGKELMNHMILLLKEKGYRQMSLAVQKENHAVRLYEKVGFQVIKETEEECVMRLEQ